MLAHFYLSRLLLTTGRVDDAAVEIQQATTLDPVNFPNLIVSALTLSIAGRHDEAIAAGDRAWEADSTSTAAQQLGAIALLRGGRTSDARRRADVTLRLARDTVDAAASAYVIGVAGDTARAADMARALSRRATDHPRVNYSLTRAWLGAGNSAEALSALERAVSHQEPIVSLVPFSDASYDPLRASPRFAALVRKLGLDVALFTSPTGGRPR
ncbi:MAG: tetratricopeptide repeat protein [Polaromonas sp.]|nr:tetratricopeptide repeat protein [Gemmatimonadaceae bacterium]